MDAWGTALFQELVNLLRGNTSHSAGGTQVNGVTTSLTPIITGQIAVGPGTLTCRNLGGNPANFEVAYSYDGTNFQVAAAPGLNGVAANTDGPTYQIPAVRPPYIRVRAAATTGTTNVLVEMRIVG